MTNELGSQVKSFDYVAFLAEQRDSVVAAIQAQGGIDFDALSEPVPRNKGTGIDFFSLPGQTFEGLALGFKRYREFSRIGRNDTVGGFILEIATLALIGRNGQELFDMLPKIHYEVTDLDNRPFGIITEDFTRHGELYYSYSDQLRSLPDMLSHPEAVEIENLMGVVGVFESRKIAGQKKVRKIMDVAPLYDNGVIYGPESDSGYLEWFEEELALNSVGSQISRCRVRISEVSPEKTK